MNEVLDFLRAFGRAFLKLLIAALVGVGASLVTMGVRAQSGAEVWKNANPPFGDLLLGIGVGLLGGAVMLLLLFYWPSSRKTRATVERDQSGSPKKIA